MDPITLAPAVLSVLLPYLVKAGEKAAEKIGETLPENAGKLWGTLTEKFAGKDAVKDLVENPSDQDAQGAFRLQLKKALSEDPEFLAALTGLLEKAQQEAIQSNVSARDGGIAVNISGNAEGNIVIGNNNAVNSPTRKK